ncbi:hypothetical protein [Microseira wollei]|nr:hypothetical protein [Microseira wollei]
MVLNELSLRAVANNIQTARQRMSDLIATARYAAELGVKPIIRTHSQFYATLLADNYSLSNWVVDRSVDRDEQRFILTAAKTPFLADVQNSEIENRNLLSEFYYEQELSEGLGIAYLLETLALSLASEQCWDCDRLNLALRQIDESGEVIDEIVEIVHASCTAHVQAHADWIKNRIRTGVRDGLELWDRKEVLFPNLEFCDGVCKQMQSLGRGNPMLRQVVKRLFELEDYCKTWTEGALDLDSIPSKASPESDSRLKQFKEQLTFLCPDGQERLFSLHVRMTPGAWRLHFFAEQALGKIIIGYIGLKIQ